MHPPRWPLMETSFPGSIGGNPRSSLSNTHTHSLIKVLMYKQHTPPACVHHTRGFANWLAGKRDVRAYVSCHRTPSGQARPGGDDLICPRGDNNPQSCVCVSVCVCTSSRICTWQIIKFNLIKIKLKLGNNYK